MTGLTQEEQAFVPVADETGSDWKAVRHTVLRGLVLGAFLLAVFVVIILAYRSGVLGEGHVSGRPIFKDVPAEYPQRDHIEEAARLGIVPGKSKDVFDLTAKVTRAQLAEVLARTLRWPVTREETEPFADVRGNRDEIDAADYVAVAYRHGVLVGTGKNPPVFRPENKVTVQDVVTAFIKAAGGRLKAPDKEDKVIAGLDLPADFKKVLQTAKAHSLLVGTWTDVKEQDFKAEITREQLAVISVNMRRALKLR